MLAYYLGFFTSFLLFSCILSFVATSIPVGIGVAVTLTALGYGLRRWLA